MIPLIVLCGFLWATKKNTMTYQMNLFALDERIHRLTAFCTLRLGKRPTRRTVEVAMLRHLLNSAGSSADQMLELSRQLFPSVEEAPQ